MRLSMCQIINYLELLDYQIIQEYILKQNDDLKGGTLTTHIALEYIKEYLVKLQALSCKYASDYTIKGLSDPMTCHLSETESLLYYRSHHWKQVHDELLSLYGILV